MLEKVANHCRRTLLQFCSHLPFHDLAHTEEVVGNVRQIGQELGLSPEELEPVIIAAWFHDTGFKKIYTGHENVSIQLAKEFLLAEGYPEDLLQVVISCIEATRMPQRPSGLLPEILADADIFHISKENFFFRKLLLRREWEMILCKRYTDHEWHLLNLDFLLTHRFFTRFGKQLLMEGQHMNERKVQKILAFYAEQ